VAQEATRSWATVMLRDIQRQLLSPQWHPTLNGNLRLQDLRPASDRSVWWLCPQGHQWQAPVFSRTSGGQGCSRCALMRRATTSMRRSQDRKGR
jgi:hypothetical protein